MEERLSKLLNETINLTGCGRTDTGVHAKEFFAHFDSGKENLHLVPDYVYKFNSVLPKEIAVSKILSVRPDANARFHATSRTYKYYITKARNPFLIDRACFIHNTLNIDAMKKGCKALFDYEDFSCFSKSRTQVKTNICKIKEAMWEEQGEMLVFTITADRFLRNMVRAIVGTMLDIGKEKISLVDFRKIIEEKNRSGAGMSVPAGGVYLESVKYKKEIFI